MRERTMRWKLRRLRRYIRQLLRCSGAYAVRPMPYCFQFCHTIDRNITVYLKNKDMDLTLLITYIHSDWNRFIEVHLHLPGYYVQVCDKSQKPTRQNRKIHQSICRIEQILLAIGER